jgi:hypothetical protein
MFLFRPGVSWWYSIFGMVIRGLYRRTATTLRQQNGIRIGSAQFGSAFAGGDYAMDNFRDSAGFMVAWTRQFVHIGRVYPYSPGSRARGACHQSPQRTR